MINSLNYKLQLISVPLRNFLQRKTICNIMKFKPSNEFLISCSLSHAHVSSFHTTTLPTSPSVIEKFPVPNFLFSFTPTRQLEEFIVHQKIGRKLCLPAKIRQQHPNLMHGAAI